MTKEELASLINGNEYRNETTPEIEKIAKDNNLVIVFGASDDLMEMRGAIDDEFGLEVYLNTKGVINNDCHNDDCPCFVKRKLAGKLVEAVWNSYAKEGEHVWTIKTEIPHATFMIKEDDENFCQGIVFSLDEL